MYFKTGVYYIKAATSYQVTLVDGQTRNNFLSEVCGHESQDGVICQSLSLLDRWNCSREPPASPSRESSHNNSHVTNCTMYQYIHTTTTTLDGQLSRRTRYTSTRKNNHSLTSYLCGHWTIPLITFLYFDLLHYFCLPLPSYDCLALVIYLLTSHSLPFKSSLHSLPPCCCWLRIMKWIQSGTTACNSYTHCWWAECIKTGILNWQSAVQKATLLHDQITDRCLDALFLTKM